MKDKRTAIKKTLKAVAADLLLGVLAGLLANLLSKWLGL